MGTAHKVSQLLWGRRASDTEEAARLQRRTVLPFAPRRPSRRLPALDATLVRYKSTRRYIVRRGRGPTEWFCEVWLDSVRLRAMATENMTEVVRCVDECRSEIEQLVARGWRFLIAGGGVGIARIRITTGNRISRDPLNTRARHSERHMPLPSDAASFQTRAAPTTTNRNAARSGLLGDAQVDDDDPETDEHTIADVDGSPGVAGIALVDEFTAGTLRQQVHPAAVEWTLPAVRTAPRPTTANRDAKQPGPAHEPHAAEPTRPNRSARRATAAPWWTSRSRCRCARCAP